MTTTTIERRGHCAKFSAPILAAITKWVTSVDTTGTWTILDPFAGVGLIHQVPGLTIANELEPEWAVQGAPRAVVGDATNLPFPARSVRCLISSPSYANRMGDTYDGKGQCKACAGHAIDLTGDECGRCKGTGRDQSKRYTYTISLGRKPHHRSTSTHRFDRTYRDLHRQAWDEGARVLVPHDPAHPEAGGYLVLNISDHLRTVGPKHRRRQERVEVTAWHHQALTDRGFIYKAHLDIETARMRNGANHAARVDAEHLIVYALTP